MVGFEALAATDTMNGSTQGGLIGGSVELAKYSPLKEWVLDRHRYEPVVGTLYQ